MDKRGISPQVKRLLLAALPLFAGVFVLLGLFNHNVFSLTQGPQNAWYTPYASAVWLLCFGLLYLPVIPFAILDRAMPSLHSTFQNLSAIVALCWTPGLMWLLWKKGGQWFPD